MHIWDYLHVFLFVPSVVHRVLQLHFHFLHDSLIVTIVSWIWFQWLVNLHAGRRRQSNHLQPHLIWIKICKLLALNSSITHASKKPFFKKKKAERQMVYGFVSFYRLWFWQMHMNKNFCISFILTWWRSKDTNTFNKFKRSKVQRFFFLFLACFIISPYQDYHSSHSPRHTSVKRAMFFSTPSPILFSSCPLSQE